MVTILSGIHKFRKLSVPKLGVRPTLSKMRKTIFDILREEVEDAQILDLFSGSGSLGLEALSRGAKHITFIEGSKATAAYIKKNIALLNEEERTTVFIQDVFVALEKLSQRGKRFDIIFGDPPYSKGLAVALIQWLDAHDLLKKGGSFLVEDRFLRGEVVDPSQLKSLKLQSMRRVGQADLFHFTV